MIGWTTPTLGAAVGTGGRLDHPEAAGAPPRLHFHSASSLRTSRHLWVVNRGDWYPYRRNPLSLLDRSTRQRMTLANFASASTSATLLFTIGLNGYAEKYKDFVTSQRRYAERNGYVYLVVTRPSEKYGPSEAAWLKIAVMNDALSAGYQRVAFIDCDAEVRSSAPSLEAAFDIDPHAYVYMARGNTGRFNSGVQIVRNGEPSRAFFREVWRRMGTPIDPGDDVGWGENGHIIQLSHEVEFLAELPRCWNNMQLPPPTPEFVRHHTGPIDDAEDRLSAQVQYPTTRREKSKPSLGRLTTRPEHSALLISRAHQLATEYGPCVPVLEHIARATDT
jgi:hypothetical protein